MQKVNQKFPYFIQESHSTMFQDKSEYGVGQESGLVSVMNSTGQCFSLGQNSIALGLGVTGPLGHQASPHVISLNRKCQAYHWIFILTSIEKKQFYSPFFSLLASTLTLYPAVCGLKPWSRGFLQVMMSFFLSFFFNLSFFFFFLQWILSYIEMKQPWVYMCSTSRTPSHLPLHPLPPGFPIAPGLSTCLMHPTWAGDPLHPR